MAGSETQFQQPGIMSGYNYTPVETKLNPPIQLPGTGELWAGVGKTALAAAGQLNQTAQMIQQSPLNPMVKAQEQAQKKSSEEGVSQEEWADTLPQGYGHWMRGVDAAGNAVMKPAMEGTPTFQQHITPPPVTDPNAPAGPTINKDPTTHPAQPTPQQAGQSDFQQHPEYYYQNPATGNYERRADAPPVATPAPATTAAPGPPKDAADANKEPPLPNQASIGLVPSRGGSTAALSAGGPGTLDTGQPQDPGVEAVPAAQLRAQAQQGGNIWSPQRPAPAAPAAPGAAPDQPATPGTVPGSLSDQFAQQAQKQDQSLANWQNQTQTEPMTADDAMKWMKRKTTLAQDATYLPHGGPPGADGQPEPAYAFHMKGGGINTVPISQMVKDGGGPTVAAQNTSAVLSQSDRLKQQQQNALAAPPQQPPEAQPQAQPPTQYPNISGPPPAPTGPVQPPQGQPPAQYPNISGPPPAPTGPQAPITDNQGNPLSAYTSVASKGGLTPDQLTAQTTPGGQPAQPVSASLPTGITAPAPNMSQAEQDRIKGELSNAKGQTDDASGDESLGWSGGFQWFRNKDPKSPYFNRYYTALPGSNTWTTSRWYMGEPGYREFQLNDTVINQNLEKAAATIPQLNLQHGDIAGLSPEKKQAYLDYAKWWTSTQGSHSSDATNAVLQNREATIRAANQVLDIMDAVQKSGKSPGEYGKAAEESERRWQDFQTGMANPDQGPLSWPGRIGAWLGNAYTGGQHHPIRQDMQGALTALGKGLGGPGYQPTSGMITPAKPGFDVNIPVAVGRTVIPFNFHKEGTPAEADPLNTPAIKDISQDGISLDERRRRVVQLRDDLVKQYHDEIHLALTDNERVDKHHMDNQLALAGNAGNLSVPDNHYRTPDGQVHNPYVDPPAVQRKDLADTGALPKRGATPSQGLVVNSVQDAAKIAINHPKGTHFHYTTPGGKVFEYEVQ